MSTEKFSPERIARLQCELAEIQAAYTEHVNAEDSAWKHELAERTNEIERLQAEIARLQAEIEQLLFRADDLPSRAALYIRAIETISQLQAKNKRLEKKINDMMDRY